MRRKMGLKNCLHVTKNLYFSTSANCFYEDSLLFNNIPFPQQPIPGSSTAISAGAAAESLCKQLEKTTAGLMDPTLPAGQPRFIQYRCPA